ncbi:NACHT and WD repeat domain-containing protein 2-like [Lineus longissimus]|uniref:NACHT and WD repeat domain-containing protein 2-like n=1 Tax=Lineus longissimus TaxID=88925 RepID=UPI00315CF57E
MATRELILSGKVGDLPQIPSKIVRIFISSTFSDTTEERNYLMEHVYPQLQKYCMAKYGLEFQVVDMRWGIMEEAQDDHMTSNICLKEIETCQRLSIGPNFVVLLGNKYGYRPFPVCISEDEFDLIVAALLEEGIDIDVLVKWFHHDENAVPPFYRLQTISKVLEHYNDNENEDLKKADQRKWGKIFAELQDLLRVGSKLCAEQGHLTEEEVEKYFISVTEQEIKVGILEQSDPKSHCFCLIRNLPDIITHLKHPKAHRYIDMKPGEYHRDVEAQKLLISLRDQKISEKLPPENIINKTIFWSEDGGISKHDHKNYIQELGENFYRKIMAMVDDVMDKTDPLFSDELTTEVLQHGILCQKRCSVFHGRENIVDRIKNILTNAQQSLISQQPLVVFGESGCGKTSVMAKCAQTICTWVSDEVLSVSPVVVMRFLGTTPKSSNIRQVLYTVCQQITAVYGEDVEDVPNEQDQLVIYFSDILRVATAEKPLVIFLDSLDQLSHVGGAHRLNWLPRSVPSHCHIIVSTIPAMHGILAKMKRLYHHSRFINVEPLEQNICMDILNSWLKQEGRQLTSKQIQKVEDAFTHCSLPLFTSLVFEEVRVWRSYTSVDECVLEKSVRGCIQKLFERVELQHGRVLTSHALAFLTASRNGLSDVEMNHLLSLDDQVLDEVFVFWFPPMRRIPDLLWARIKDNLQTYFIEKEADGMTVNNWYHRQFGEVATQRYLSNPDMKKYIHSLMADFFVGKWGGGKGKPFKFTDHQMKRFGLDKRESEADRLVPEQPMEFHIEDAIHYNLRMLNELPYHLIESDRTTDLFTNVLFNYSWIYHKTKALSAQDVVMDYIIALATSPEVYQEARPLVQALRLAANTLNQNPNSLPVELTGRLHSLVKEVRGRNVLSNIAVLLADCTTKGLKHSALVPSHQCFEPPNPHLLCNLEGHKSLVTDLRFDENIPVLYSVSKDNSIIAWDTEIGEHVSLLNLENIELHRWTNLFCTYDGENIICDTHTDDSPLLVIDPTSFEIRHRVGARKMPNCCNTAISEHYVCRNGVIIDLRSGKEIVSLPDHLGTTDFCKVAIDEKNGTFLVSVETDVLIINMGSLEISGKLRGRYKPSSIIVRGDLAIVGYSVECNVRIFHICPGNFSFTQEKHDYKFDFLQDKTTNGINMYRQEVSGLILSNDKKRFLVNLQQRYIVSIKVRTQQVTLMAPSRIEEPCYFHADYSADRMLVVCAESRHICLWARKSGNSLAVVAITSGTPIHKFAVSCYDNRVATVTMSENSIKIWDLDKLKTISKLNLPEPLKYENPLSESAIQVRGDYVFIKKFLPLTSEQAFHYNDYFGIDIVGISSGKKRVLLPYDKYGKLTDFSLSLDHAILVLLIEHKMSQHIYVINLYESKIVYKFPWEDRLETIQISPGKQFLFLRGQKIILYNLAQKEAVREFENDPVMTLTDSHVIARDDEKIIIAAMPYDVLTILDTGFVVSAINLVPNNPRLVLASEKKDKSCDVHFIDFISGSVIGKISRVSKHGISDISKNGAIIIDKKLHVYSVKDMNCLGRIRALSDNIDAKLSFDGRYTYWLDKENAMVRAYHIENGKPIAQCDLHAEPVSLKLAQFGYHIIIGCQDGRLVMLRLRDLEGMDTHKLFKDVLPSMASKAIGAVDNFISTLDPAIEKVYESVRFYVMPKLTPEVLQQIKADASNKSQLAVSKSPAGSRSVSSDSGSDNCSHGSSVCNLI